MTNKVDHTDYNAILKQVITEIHSTQLLIAHRVNNTMIQMYWNIGKELSERGVVEGHGSSVVNRLSADLRVEFPDVTSFSPRNLWHMKRLYENYHQEDLKLQQAVAVLPWSHHILIMTKSKSKEEARFYIESAVEMGLTRSVLLNFIKADTYNHARLQPKLHNFEKALPEDLHEQASEILKSTYNLEFLGIRTAVKERELESRILEKIKLFLLELGDGFSFIGNQYRLQLNQKEYYVDLLLFHRKLKALVAIELKMGEFEPEYVGKMNHYLGLLDDQVRMSDENPSIGIILCADKDHVEVEVALRDINKPIAVADYNLQFPAKQLKEMIVREMQANEAQANNADDAIMDNAF